MKRTGTTEAEPTERTVVLKNGEAVIGVEEAVAIRDATPKGQRGALPFRCVTCHAKVTAFRGGNGAGGANDRAHVEHRKAGACRGLPGVRLSDLRPRAA